MVYFHSLGCLLGFSNSVDSVFKNKRLDYENTRIRKSIIYRWFIDCFIWWVYDLRNIKSCVMKRLTSNDLAINGLKQITFLDEFVYVHQYGSHDYHKDIENMEFKKTNNRFVGPDLMDSETIYKRISESEKRYNDLDWQLSQLEHRFKVKITYTKN